MSPLSDEESVQTVPQNADGDVYRAVIYCRVSTDDKGQTNENQEFMCRKWCDAHGYEVVDVYRDTITGTTIIRPGLNMMIARIKSERDVDYIVAYDQSRITRGEDPKNNFDAVKDLLAGSRCRFRFVLMDVDDSNIAGKILGDLNTRINAQENKLRSERTKAALMKLKSDGKHVGRPARFLIAEDIEAKPDGVFKAGVTVVMPEKTLYDYARSGYTLNYVAEKILHIPPTCLVWELHERQPDNPKCRYKGLKDRYTPYMQILHSVLLAESDGNGGCKPSELQRVGNPDESALQRVVE